jgi:MFS family permease
LDLVCEPKQKISLVGSAYFIGFALGFGLFSLPDNYGRKKFLNCTMPIYLIASLVVVHHPNLVAKGIGFFV